MLKPWVGSVALTLLGASALGADEATPDISTWRWRVSMLTQPPRPDAVLDNLAFDQHYERYSVTRGREASEDDK